MKVNYASIIEAMAERIPGQPAVIFGDKVTSYQQFNDNASKLAQLLLDAGVKQDGKVGLFLYNCTEYMEATLAAFKIRAIPININYRYTGDELIYLLNDCDADALVFHSSLADRVSEVYQRLPNLKKLICVDDGDSVPDYAIDYNQVLNTISPATPIERSPNDTLMLYTGGTTGMPKGVEYSMTDMLGAMVQELPQFLRIKKPASLDELLDQAEERASNGESLVSLPASPLMHTAAIINSGLPIQLLGGTLVILTSRSFDSRELWQAVEKHRVNHMVIVGDTFAIPMLDVIDEDKAKGKTYDASSMKMLMSSGVMFSKSSKERLLELADMMIIDGAGASEGGMAIQMSSRQNPPSETGSFIALPTTQIFNEDYEMVPRGSGEVGLIGMGGPLPRGYYKDSKKTDNTFRTINGVRYGFTGDMGTIDENGMLTFLGRGSNCINTGGEKVFPEEVEETLKKHPEVRDCLVVGLADERFGQTVAAVVSVRSDIDDPLTTLKEFASDYLARYKLPRTIKVVDIVQRAPNGKADYKWAQSCFE